MPTRSFPVAAITGPLLAFVLLSSVSCASRRRLGPFRVLRANPDYLLRSPDGNNTPFPEVLERYSVVGPGWVELRPQMQLRIENAYYREGAPKRGLANFLGTETAQYQVRPTGALRQISVASTVKQPPADQPPVLELMHASQRRYRHHRFFYQILFTKRAELRSAALLGAASVTEMNRLTARLLTEPDSICGGESVHCTVFPEACTVALEIEIVVNGTPRTVVWGSLLAHVAQRPRRVEMWRLHSGRLTPVELDPSDAAALRLPLLPGDRIQWE